MSTTTAPVFGQSAPPHVDDSDPVVIDDPALLVQGLSVDYGSGPDAVHAVRDVDLRIGEGERVALVGESGSGKTTLGLALAGFLTQPGVQVRADRFEFQGRPVELGRRGRLPARIPGISMVFQDAMTSLDPVWTIGSQLVAVIRASDDVTREQARERAREWLRRVGIDSVDRVMKNRPYELSGGMRQRAMVALALCSRPDLLIADEPTSALDASLSRATMDLLLELTEETGAALLIISHDILLCQEYSDTTVVMYRGDVVDRGSSRTLAGTARHPYTIGLLHCVPTLRSASLDELPTLDSFLASAGISVDGAELTR